jgi:hypothetical protein
MLNLWIPSVKCALRSLGVSIYVDLFAYRYERPILILLRYCMAKIECQVIKRRVISDQQSSGVFYSWTAYSWNELYSYPLLSLFGAYPVFVRSSERCKTHATASRGSLGFLPQEDQRKRRFRSSRSLGEINIRRKNVPPTEDGKKIYRGRRGMFVGARENVGATNLPLARIPHHL